MSQSREGLYIMTFLAMIGGFVAMDRTKGLKGKVDDLERSVKSINPFAQDSRPVLKEQNGQRFYELLNGQRAYIEINGKPAELYITNKVSLEK